MKKRQVWIRKFAKKDESFHTLLFLSVRSETRSRSLLRISWKVKPYFYLKIKESIKRQTNEKP